MSKDNLFIGGRFIVECYDKYGTLKWIEDTRNLVVDQGRNYILDTATTSGTQITSWYIALFEDNHTPVAGNTYASPGYTESTAYDESVRQEWVKTRTAGTVSNSASKAIFTINATKIIYGASMVGGGSAASTKGNTAGGGSLLCASKFDAERSVEDDDILRVTYEITLSTT